MSQTITTDLPVLTTKSNDKVSLYHDRICATCGGDLVSDGDDPAVVFCGQCLAVDLAPVQATLAALAWAKAGGHAIDGISVSEWTHEEREKPPIAIPGRYWSITLEIAERMVTAPLFVIQQDDGNMQVVPDDFAKCYDQTDGCDRYILTDADGTRRCPEHGPVTAWDIPLSFYTDEDGPEMFVQDATDFARYGTVQWFLDYDEKVQDAENDENDERE